MLQMVDLFSKLLSICSKHPPPPTLYPVTSPTSSVEKLARLSSPGPRASGVWMAQGVHVD